jgi:hypothetical protein
MLYETRGELPQESSVALPKRIVRPPPLQPSFKQVVAICKVLWRGNIDDIWDEEGE